MVEIVIGDKPASVSFMPSLSSGGGHRLRHGCGDAAAEGPERGGERARQDGGVPHHRGGEPGTNCIKIGLPGKSILGDYFQENRTSQRPVLLLRISFPGRPIFIQLVPGSPPRWCGMPPS